MYFVDKGGGGSKSTKNVCTSLWTAPMETEHCTKFSFEIQLEARTLSIECALNRLLSTGFLTKVKVF